ncbi:RepB family DNA primase [Granulicella sp. S190]|uniref:RepB family DNA primase n=1 Tax=Granulicella sp. S190 TaxID=1747226 RepID=UPI0020B11E0D|nr:RepB family DNA primase [Granulicella sp. S190]
MLAAIEAPLYDVGVLSERGMLPGLDGISATAVFEKLSMVKYHNAHASHIYMRPSEEQRFTTLDDLSESSLAKLSVDDFNPCTVVETSAGNFQAWLKHTRVFSKLLGTFAAQRLAERYGADPSTADWGRFGRLPGFTDCNPKYRKPNRLFPFVRLHSHSGQQYPMAGAFEQQITTLYGAREQEHQAKRLKVLFLSEGDRGSRTCLPSDSEARPSTVTVRRSRHRLPCRSFC